MKKVVDNRKQAQGSERCYVKQVVKQKGHITEGKVIFFGNEEFQNECIFFCGEVRKPSDFLEAQIKGGDIRVGEYAGILCFEMTDAKKCRDKVEDIVRKIDEVVHKIRDSQKHRYHCESDAYVVL